MPTPTFNFGWLKPDIGGSTGAWGSLLNTDLDEIDAVVGAVMPAPNQIHLNSPAAPGWNPIFGQVAGVNRWGLYIGDGETETGGNAGSNFLIQSYSDTGAFVSNAFEIIRATGSATFGAAVTVNSTLNVVGAAQINGVASFPSGITFPSFYGHTLQFGWDGANVRIRVDSTDIGGIAIAGAGGSFLPISGGTITGNLGVNGTLNVNGAIGFATTVAANGAAFFGSTLNVSGAASFNSSIGAGGVISSNQYFVVGGSVTALFAHYLQLDTNVTIAGSSSGGMTLNIPGGTGITFNSGGVEMSEMDYGGNFFVAGQAFKPVAGGWLSSSDARVKTIERPYTLGLDEVMKLKPIVYRYKANDAEPGKTSRVERFKDRSYAGLIAQDVEEIFPNMVDKRKGWIDGREVDDLRTLDTYELTFVLINACKELAARVAALEAKAA